jgi:hypothetical protein
MSSAALSLSARKKGRRTALSYKREVSPFPSDETSVESAKYLSVFLFVIERLRTITSETELSEIKNYYCNFPCKSKGNIDLREDPIPFEHPWFVNPFHVKPCALDASSFATFMTDPGFRKGEGGGAKIYRQGNLLRMNERYDDDSSNLSDIPYPQLSRFYPRAIKLEGEKKAKVGRSLHACAVEGNVAVVTESNSILSFLHKEDTIYSEKTTYFNVSESEGESRFDENYAFDFCFYWNLIKSEDNDDDDCK